MLHDLGWQSLDGRRQDQCLVDSIQSGCILLTKPKHSRLKIKIGTFGNCKVKTFNIKKIIFNGVRQ